jgi:hypothetical protein
MPNKPKSIGADLLDATAAILRGRKKRSPLSYKPPPREFKSTVRMEDDRLGWHMHNWQRWMKLRSYPGRLPGRASGGIGISGSRDFDAMCATEDGKCAFAVDAIVQELPSAQHAAVYIFHDIAEEGAYAFRFPRNNKEELYVLALETVRAGLTRRGIW